MSSSSVSTSAPAAVRQPRPPKPNIPQTLGDRRLVLDGVRSYVAKESLVPPLPLAEVRGHALRIAESLPCDPAYVDYIAVLINNELWREAFSAVPFERRLLLLPKCLRSVDKCRAPFDEFGLLCKRCGQCSIQDLQSEAERLGYAMLVAEGSAVVMALIQANKVEAIAGVSCLNVLERAFPSMESAAIPGVAIPLLQDDCRETSVDLDWVRDYLYLSADDRTRRLDLDALREEVTSWFVRPSLDAIMGSCEGRTEEIAREWLARGGKRWRPFLAASTFQALRSDSEEGIPDAFQAIAVAVECFHKASLIHDDIEDDDTERYGAKTLHSEYGLAVALNVGDLLIGEGYRLVATSRFSSEQKSEMSRFAAEGHRQLCRGQGAELCWRNDRSPLAQIEVLDVFRRKTAPAFEVALHLGALAAGCEPHEGVAAALATYSEALGIAYQIRDDLEDAIQDAGANRLSLFPLVSRDHASLLMESYKKDAIGSLSAIANPSLKGLLRRVLGRIFNETELHAWCLEVQGSLSK